MRPFATYIEYLLMTQHYCYVPGRGAYMLAEESASVKMENEMADEKPLFIAPHRVVRFSQLHYHDDGMLASLLMEAEGMTYDEACRYIERQAPLLPEQFLQSATLHTDIENFGFENLSVDTWAGIERKKALALAPALTPDANQEEKSDSGLANAHPDTIAIPKYWIRRAAAVLLIIVCYFANFLGLNDRVPEEHLAAVLDINMLQRAALVQQDWETDAEECDLNEWQNEYEAVAEMLDAEDMADASDSDELYAMAEETEPATEIAETPAPAPVAETPDPRKWNESLPIRSMDSEMAMAKSKTGRLYYIIIASCGSESDAQRALGNLKHAGYNDVGILERDGRFRLYVNFFDVKSEAESYLSKLRGIDRFHDAWLLPVRDGSLSHIIKNTYNDNQLSMELSHLNQRTERDQG